MNTADFLISGFGGTPLVSSLSAEHHFHAQQLGAAIFHSWSCSCATLSFGGLPLPLRCKPLKGVVRASVARAAPAFLDALLISLCPTNVVLWLAAETRPGWC